MKIEELVREALYRESLNQANRNIKKANIWHETQEMRDKCFWLILEKLSLDFDYEEMKTYLWLSEDFRIPTLGLYQNGQPKEDNIPFHLKIPGCNTISNFMTISKVHGGNITCHSYGPWRVRDNRYDHLGEAILYAQYLFQWDEERKEREKRYYEEGNEI